MVPFRHTQPSLGVSGLGPTDTEHPGATDRANTLSRWLTVLHGNALGVLHFSLGSALHAIRLHLVLPNFYSQSRITDEDNGVNSAVCAPKWENEFHLDDG